MSTRKSQAIRPAWVRCHLHDMRRQWLLWARPVFFSERKVGLDYNEQFTPTLDRRLSLAGSRLAGILNRVFR